MPPVIDARDLGKQYRLGTSSAPYGSLRESLAALALSPLRWARRSSSPTKPAAPTEFWALKDVTFQIDAGEAVGIIGRNGAGKSTLLKILSRITAPTTGEVSLRGRVGSLLEVGTGFHPEMTGRENIFVNGAIMGMSRHEVRTRFDDIVDFAGVSAFIDTPVKRYSSGMYVRLAFAVAAHLEPDILVVDEVLAVGDTDFQRKCLGKMEGVAKGGRTVLFVSHNMPAVTRLCRRAILLQHGTIRSDGPVADVVRDYLGGTAGETPTETDWERLGRMPGSADVRLLATRIFADGMQSTMVDIRKPIAVEIDFEILQERLPIHPNIVVNNDESQCVFISSDVMQPETRKPRAPGRYRSRVSIPGNFLAEGLFSVDVAMSTVNPVILHCEERGVLVFHVNDPGEGDSARGDYGGPYPGVVRPALPWATERLA